MLHYLVPDSICREFTAGNNNGSLQGAALFLDLSGFSAMVDTLMQRGQHGAEVAATVMRAALDPLVEHVYSHSGEITGMAGDAFTAVFAPRENEDAAGTASRALAAAWRMQETMAVVGRQQSPYGEFVLAAKIGLAWGEVNWGIARSEDGRRGMYYYRGAAIDGCAASEHLAGPGDIVLARELHALVQGLVDAIAVEDHQRVVAVRGALPEPAAIAPRTADLETMARFFPRDIVAQPFSGEFRWVVSLFIALPTISTDTQLTAFMRTLFALQDRYGGLLNRLDFGDKGANVLLFWGAPVAYENDVQRALDLVLELEALTSLPVHAGIALRVAHAGLIGGALREEYTCYGRGVNLAARLMTAAPRDEIWLDEEVARRAARHYDLEPLGERPFKGFAQAQRVYLLIQHKEIHEVEYRTPWIGRRAELARLGEFTRPLAEGRQAGVMLILGEAGLGKSRLVHALRTTPGTPAFEAHWAVCQADQTLRDSLHPFRYWLTHYFEQSPSQAEARNKRSFSRRMEALLTDTTDRGMARELDRVRSFLGAVVGLHWADSLYEEVDPQGRFENTLDALKTLIKAESLRQPLILAIEDGQWLDPDSVTLLERLERNVEEFAFAVIITARPEPLEPQAGQARARLAVQQGWQQIDLAQMADEDLVALTASALDAPVAPDLARLVVDRADGNPFFAEQVVLYLREQGLLTADQAGALTVGELQETLLPADIHALLIARIDQLTQGLKTLVETAAVLGREFEVQLLSRMLHRESDLRPDLEQVEAAAVWSRLSELAYIFKHTLLRDAAYEMLLRSRRQALHRLAAGAIETVHAADLSTQLSALAFHYEEAREGPRALFYLNWAGDAAGQAYQNSQAIDFYSRALALADEPAARLALLLAREAINDRLGRRSSQAEDLVAAHDLATQLGDDKTRVQVMQRQANLARLTGAYDEALVTLEQALVLAKGTGDRGLQATTASIRGRILMQQGNYDEAASQMREALPLAQDNESTALEAQVRYDLGLIAYYQDRYAEAQRHFTEAQAIFQTLGNRKGEVNCLLMFGTVQYRNGKYVEAKLHLEAALHVCEEIGWRHGAAFIHGNLGNTVVDLGDYVSGRRHYEQALEIAREVTDREGEAVSLDSLGSAAQMMGQAELARQLLMRGLEIDRQIGYRRGEGYALTHLGQALLDLDDLEGAEEAFRQALAVRQALGIIGGVVVDNLVGLAQVSLARNLPGQALAYAQEALAQMQLGGMASVEFPVWAHLVCYQVLQAAAGDDSAGRAQSREVLQQGYDLLKERAERIADEPLRRSFLQNVPFNRRLLEVWQAEQES